MLDVTTPAIVPMKCYKNNNENYWMHIKCAGHGIEIITEMPQQLTFGVGSEWESRLPYNLASMLSNIPFNLGKIAEAGVNLTAGNAIYQNTSWQMWMGTSPIEIPLTLQFDAETSALDQVHRPINALLTMALPNNSAGGFLTPPGPRHAPLSGFVGGDGDYSVDILIGRNILVLYDCILVSVNATFDTRLASDGYPISGTAEITVRTGKIYGSSDWASAVGLAAGYNSYEGPSIIEQLGEAFGFNDSSN